MTALKRLRPKEEFHVTDVKSFSWSYDSIFNYILLKTFCSDLRLGSIISYDLIKADYVNRKSFHSIRYIACSLTIIKTIHPNIPTCHSLRCQLSLIQTELMLKRPAAVNDSWMCRQGTMSRMWISPHLDTELGPRQRFNVAQGRKWEENRHPHSPVPVPTETQGTPWKGMWHYSDMRYFS